MYTRSNYNHYSTVIPGKIAVINLLSGTVILLPKDVGHYLVNNLFAAINTSTLTTLESKGIIYRGNKEMQLVEKLKAARNETKQKEFENKTHFYIIPTLKCNFCCNYCYLQDYKNNHTILQNREVDAILKHITKHGKEGLRVTLIGGEPLLPETREVMRYMLPKLLEYGISYDFITNGYYIDEFFKEGIFNKNLKHVQITFDGFENNHNTKRFLSSTKEGSFAKLIDNVALCLENNIFTFARLNVYEENINDIALLYHLFEEKGFIVNKNFHFYISPVLNNGDYDTYKMPDRKYLIEHFLNLDEKIINTVDTRHFHGFHYIRNIFHNKETLLPTLSRCEATLGNFCFTPGGHIYSCIEALGNEEFIVGSYLPDLHIQPKKMKTWIDMDFVNDECIKCKAAFICAGGCPRKELTTETKDCKHVQAEIKLSFDYFLKKL